MNKSNLQTIIIYFLFISCLNGYIDESPENKTENEVNKLNQETEITSLPSSQVKDIKFAQTHVIPAQGLFWKENGNNQSNSLKLVPNRDTLLLVSYEKTLIGLPNSFYIIISNSYSNTSLFLRPPHLLPSTFANYPGSYGNDYFSVIIPSKLMKSGIEIIVSSHTSGVVKPSFAMESKVIFKTFPFFLFGASHSNISPCSPLSVSKDIQDTIYNIWPLSSQEFKMESGFTWAELVVPPSGSNQARKITSKDEISNNDLDKLVAMIINEYRKLNGDLKLNIFYHVPIFPFNLNGGIDYSDRVYVSNSAYLSSNFNSKSNFLSGLGYVLGIHGKGSYNNSTWAYSLRNNQFIAPYILPNDDNFESCKSNNDYTTFENGKQLCIKREIQSNIAQSIFYPDYICGLIQKEIENIVHYDNESRKFMTWDSVNQTNVEYRPTNVSGGFQYLDDGFPIPTSVNVDVYTIAMVYNSAQNSNSSSCGKNCSMIYPIIKTKGNLVRYIDPSNDDERDLIEEPNLRDLWGYCSESGCDYSLRVTYSDGSVRLKLLQKGQREFDQARGPIQPDYQNPLSPKSIVYIIENVPADKPLTKVELLYTPYGFKRYRVNSEVLLSKLIDNNDQFK